LDDLSTLSESAYTAGTGPFSDVCPAWWPDNPNSSVQSNHKIDDLFHAAVNSRGAFLNAADPQELVAAMQTIKDLIEDQTGTASSVAINANKIEEDTLLFQTTYDSSDWSGDMLAKCLDSEGLVASCGKVTCEVACSTAYTSCATACAEGDTACLAACKTAQTTCAGSCTGQTCAQTQATCLASCTDSSCQTACNSAYKTCQLDPPEVKWSASKKLATTTASARQIITSNESGVGVAFRYDELSASMKTKLQGDSYILEYLRGEATYERKNDSTNFRNFRNRSSKLGDFINSEPYHYSNASLGVDWVIAGANDGMLHVFDGNTGQEIFAYIPQEVFDNISLLSKETYSDNHKFFVDGYITVQDLGGKVVLVGGLGKGGKGFFALDLTAAQTYEADIEANADKIVLWEYTPDAFSSIPSIANNLGYSFSRPQIVKSNDASASWVLVFGNGYESVNMHSALFTIGLDSNGAIKWSQMIDTGEGSNTSGTGCNGLSTPALIYPQGDGKNDYAYAGDLLGNLWKFDLSDSNRTNWAVYFANTTGGKEPLFRARSEAGYRQPITMQPVISSACPLDTKGYMVLFGTGRILDPSIDFLDQSVQTVYGIWDWSTAWEASAATVNPKQTFLGTFQSNNTSLTSSCTSSCAAILGDASSFGSCTYQCAGDADCLAECQLEYSACVTNCGAVRNLSNVTNVVGSTASPYVTLLRQTQIWAGGINYKSDGSVGEAVYGATNLDVYDQIARVMSDNLIDWYLPVEQDEFSSNPHKTTKHVGWYFDLPANGERIVRDMTVANSKLIFTSTIPSNSPCKSGGTSYHWAVDACTGGRLGSAFFDLNSDERINGYDYINIGTEAVPIWVAVSSIGVRGISPAVTVVDVVKNAYERLYYPDEDDLATVLGNVYGTPIIYWRDLEWK
jgi:type IV pilus assembly protein PilY1